MPDLDRIDAMPCERSRARAGNRSRWNSRALSSRACRETSRVISFGAAQFKPRVMSGDSVSDCLGSRLANIAGLAPSCELGHNLIVGAQETWTFSAARDDRVVGEFRTSRRRLRAVSLA